MEPTVTGEHGSSTWLLGGFVVGIVANPSGNVVVLNQGIIIVCEIVCGIGEIYNYASPLRFRLQGYVYMLCTDMGTCILA